ncbi:unnamed protein product [Parajaminaea phylloscopi]
MASIFAQVVREVGQYASAGLHYRDFNAGNVLVEVDDAHSAIADQEGDPRLVLIDHGHMRPRTGDGPPRAREWPPYSIRCAPKLPSRQQPSRRPLCQSTSRRRSLDTSTPNPSSAPFRCLRRSKGLCRAPRSDEKPIRTPTESHSRWLGHLGRAQSRAKVTERAGAIRKAFEELSRGGLAAQVAAGTLQVEIAGDDYEVPLPGWVEGPATLGERVVRGAEYRKMAGPFGAGGVASAWVDRDLDVGRQPLDLSSVVMEEGGEWDDLLVALADCAAVAHGTQFSSLHGCKFFSLDAAKGYHQIPIDPRDRHKTAVVTHFGLFNTVSCHLVFAMRRPCSRDSWRHSS